MNHQSDSSGGYLDVHFTEPAMQVQGGASENDLHKGDPTLHNNDYITLNTGSDEQLDCYGYRRNLCKTALFGLLVVLSLGTLLLVVYWKPEWGVYLRLSRCAIKRATTFILKDAFGHIFVEQIVVEQLEDGPKTATGEFAYIDSEVSDAADDTTVLTVRHKMYMKYFEHKHVRYMWKKENNIYTRLDGLPADLTCNDMHEMFPGLVPDEQAHKLQVYGENAIDVQVKSYIKLFFQEVLNPFYIFQICSVILWSVDGYYVYATCIVLISAISLTIEMYETRKQSRTLREMVSSAETTVTVLRNAGTDTEEVETSRLVPGDVLLVPAKGCMMMCDAVLLSGNAIVNESMLTGESVPVTKTPVPTDGQLYNPDAHKRHTLFCGTHVIQTRYYGDAKVKAVVIRTGFATAKGDLVRSILYPKPIGFKFYQDAIKFIGILACIAAVGMSYSIATLVKNGETTSKVVIRALDIITIVVPPALPAAMTVGTVYAQNRLKKQGIFCISPPRINICGKLKCICFDKTGTLTEDGLDMWGVVTVTENRFDHETLDPSVLPSRSPFVIAMATCHSLTIIDNELMGDPLDLKMFHSLRWILEEPGRDTSKFDSLMPTMVKPVTRDTYTDSDQVPFEVGIVRQFTFSSGLQRMSVLTRVLGADHMDIYTKGAPEKIVSLCRKETVPEDFHEILHKFTRKGFRVIALAYKPLETKLSWHQAQRISRESVESGLEFLGLLVMENAMKPETTPVIKQLQQADIRTVMITGDNMLTAISVGRQCGMVQGKERVILANAFPPEGDRTARIRWEDADQDADLPSTIPSDNGTQEYQTIHLEENLRYHFALNGRSFGIIRQFFPQILEKICVRGTIFARMSPDQKSQLVEHLQDLGYCVGMCGDGANDCGALKAAHAGISLSEAEASVASPFTSRTPNIECVPTVIREGRAALVTSFGVFKYMALYSMIQFVTVLILYTMSTNLGDWMFLYIDLVITTTVAVLMGHTAAYPYLVSKRPPGSLVAPVNIISIMSHIILVALVQTFAFLYLTRQKWYEPNRAAADGGTENPQTYETSVLFLISAFQYIILAFIFSKGPPYRQRIWKNVLFLVALVILTGLTILILIYPFPFLIKILQLKPLPSYIFKLTLLGIIGCHFFLALLVESFIIPSAALAKIISTLRRKKEFKNRYKTIEVELANSHDWPPVNEVTMATHESGLGSILQSLSVN